MSLMSVTSESLTREFGRDVPEMYVIIAKHSVLGMDRDGIREVIGCNDEDLVTVENDPLYREVRIYVGAIQANQTVAQSAGWDALEGIAINSLLKRAEVERDTDVLLRIAAVANKAQRRASGGKEVGIIDPSSGRTAKISLTTRLVQSFQRDGGETRTIEKQVSITDGSIQQPSFGDIDNLLSVSAVPALPRKLEVSTSTPDVSFKDLENDMKESGF